jgi:DNA-binding transcriptional LysR family regulator
MKIDTTTVHLVLAILEEGSISRAADKLNLAVAAASKRVTDLETQLGTKLFKRLPHGVKVTDSGVKLLAHIKQIDNLIDRLEGDAQALSQGSGGSIIIGAPKSVVIQSLAKDIFRVQQKYPQISLRIQEENSQVIQQLLRDKVIDVGIYEKTSGFLDLEKFHYQHDRLVLVYSRQHFQFSTEPVTIDQILNMPIVSLGKGSAILFAVQRAHKSRGRVFRQNFTVSGFDTMLALVRNGLGIGLMPPDIFSSFHPEASLGSVEIEGDWHQRSYVLSYVVGQAQVQTLHAVVEELLRSSISH